MVTGMFKPLALSFIFCASAIFSQTAPPTAPVVSPRGVVNAFTQQPAPSRVAAGGLIWINGLNLGPAAGEIAADIPWPTKLGTPAIEVLINNRLAALYSISPSRIVAQVPRQTPAGGVVNVVVRRGTVTSKAARIYIDPVRPSLRTADDSGYGLAAYTASGLTLKLSAMGLGPTDVLVPDGDVGAADGSIKPRANIDVYIGGLLTNSTTSLSADRPGEFDISVDVPPNAQPGDIISVVAGNTPANRTTYQKKSAIDVQFLAIPDGAVDFRALTASDLRGSYVFANGARDAAGCYPSYLFDFSKAKAAAIDGCLTAANRNLLSPFTVSNEGSAVAVLAGPPEADPPAGVSSKVLVFNPSNAGSMAVTLPSPAANLSSAPGGNFSAVLAGTPPKLVIVDSVTGEVADAPAGAGGGGGGGGIPVNLANLANMVDLGGGLTHVLYQPVAITNAQFAVIVGDDLDKPTAAKYAVVDPTGKALSTKDFPGGYIPLIAPAAPTPAGGGGGGGNPGLPGGAQNPFARLRSSAVTDTAARVIYMLSTKPDGSKHALVAFPLTAADPKAVEFPDGWYAAACTSSIAIFNLELGNRLALLASKTSETTFKATCPAEGYLTMDLATQTITALELGGSGQFNAAAGNAADVNDYVYGANTDPQRRNISDTLYVLDGVNNSTSRFDLPAEVATFAQITPVPELGALLALGGKTNPGDAGLVLFDLENANAKLLPTPEGFVAVQLISVFTTTRKIIAKGTKTGNTGSQFLIYDLLSGDLTIVPNPRGVAFVGTVPQTPTPGQPAQQPVNLQRGNPKSNTIHAVTFGADRKQNGMLIVNVN
jgi:uncharacterized protein (TIGR03437 family)